jgi:hypothetical protein
MNDGKLKSPDWQSLLQEVILEFSREKLIEKIQKVETLIFERLQQPLRSTDDPSEREALDHALSTLRTIKRDRLGFPDWK